MTAMLPLLFLLASTVRGPGDVESLAARADVVVHARVLKTEVTSGNGLIFTRVTLQPLETWKGPQQASLQVLVEGGAAGELSQTVSGAAEFHENEEVVVFLHQRGPSIYSVDQLALGKFAVGAPAGLPKRALRDRKGLDCVRCAAAESDDLSLDELRARVLSRVRK